MSYVSSHYHCVFSTKERRPLISTELRERLWPFLGGIARQNQMKVIEGMPDHVHILLNMTSAICGAELQPSLRDLIHLASRSQR